MAKTPTKSSSASGVDAPPILPTKIVTQVTQTPGQGVEPGTRVRKPQPDNLKQSVSSLSTARDVNEALDVLQKISGDVSLALAVRSRLADTNLVFAAYDPTHQISEDGYTLVQSIVARMDFSGDYSYGFDDRQSLLGVKQSLLLQVSKRSACMVELVLDKARLPDRLVVVPVETIVWKAGKEKVGGGKIPKIIPSQTQQTGEVDLDFPTIFYASLDQDPRTAYPTNQLTAAVREAIFSSEVMEDIRRVVNRSGHSRLIVKLNTELVTKSMPPAEKADSKKAVKWMEDLRDSVKKEIENLTPESALVFFDTAEADYLSSQIGASADYTPLMEIVDGRMSTALHTPPSVLNKRMGGSQNTSSTESLLYLKTAQGPHGPVSTVLSRAFTLAARLLGFQGYVKVGFEAIDLRPDVELEAFRQMEQARVLEQLSLGFITDQEAGLLLGSGRRAPGAPPLSGTQFYGQKPGADVPSPNGDPAKRALTGNAPKSGGGKDNASRGN